MDIKKVGLGSMNPVKFRAVSDVLHNYLGVIPCQINQIKVDSGVRAQPISIGEVILGAKNRAKRAFIDCDLSVGIESGLFHAPVNSRYLNTCACAIYDGKRFSYGLSPSFELPSDVIKAVVQGGMEVDEAVVASRLTANPNIGEDVGLIGILTGNRVVREDLVKYATIMAVLQITNKKLYYD